MSYLNYGIEAALVERAKWKIKNNPAVKERMKTILHGVSRSDLQDPAKVGRLVNRTAAALGEPLTDAQKNSIIRFVIAQRIDPNNTFHLLKLWGMFR